MPSLRDFVGQELTWVHPHFFQSLYELRAGDLCLATLRNTGAFKRVTLGEVDGQVWRFKREGAWKTQMVIYAGADETPGLPTQPIATFKRRWNGNGELLFQDGHSYRWSSSKPDFWTRVWSISDEQTTLLSMRKRRQLYISPVAKDTPDMPLLALFSLHLTLVREAEASSSG